MEGQVKRYRKNYQNTINIPTARSAATQKAFDPQDPFDVDNRSTNRSFIRIIQ